MSWFDELFNGGSGGDSYNPGGYDGSDNYGGNYGGIYEGDAGSYVGNYARNYSGNYNNDDDDTNSNNNNNNDDDDNNNNNGGDDNNNNGDDENNREYYETDQIFVSKKELFDWAFERACPKGYVLSTKRSSTHALTGEYTKISIWCDRSGKYVPKGTQQRKTGSKKCDCPFLLKGTYIKILAGWKLEVVNHEHNHEPSENLEGHARAMRFNDEEVGNVRQMKNQKIRPRHILTEIKKNNPKNLSSKRTFYNILAKIKGEETIGDTPMQVFFSLLAKGGYICWDLQWDPGYRF
ncbi:hypothetical protein SSX86_016920 [Deinandra increscens subsp. villosa]|uniref:FAR1 domain-containing protein n=1 Tax=Deinandra increscens subsp. villosa TaxID=3103831 RepID=A0AAP0CYX2_9ASTR